MAFRSYGYWNPLKKLCSTLPCHLKVACQHQRCHESMYKFIAVNRQMKGKGREKKPVSPHSILFFQREIWEILKSHLTSLGLGSSHTNQGILIKSLVLTSSHECRISKEMNKGIFQTFNVKFLYCHFDVQREIDLCICVCVF